MTTEISTHGAVPSDKGRMLVMGDVVWEVLEVHPGNGWVVEKLSPRAAVRWRRKTKWWARRKTVRRRWWAVVHGVGDLAGRARREGPTGGR